MRYLPFLIFLFWASFGSKVAAVASKDEANISISYPTITVSVFGLKPLEESLVLVGLSIKKAEKEKRLNENRIESLHHLAPQEISTTLEALGYYHSKIKAVLEPVHGGFHAKYLIELNSATYINSVTVQVVGEGKSHPKLRALVLHPPLIMGSMLRHSVYETYKQNLLSQALQLGFLNAIFERNEIRVNRDTHRADIILVLNTGNQYRIGAVTFRDPPYPCDYLERYISFKPGTPYTTDAISKFQKNLTETDLFKYVRIDPQLEQTEDYIVPLKVRLKPRPTNRFFGGTGYGTDTGMRGMLGWERRRQRYPGHKINTTIRASQRFNQFNLRYSIPGSCPATDRIVFGFRMTEETTRDKKYSRRGDLSATKIKRFGDLETILDLNYLDELYRELQGTPNERAHFLIPSAGFVWTKIKEPNPRQLGFQIGATVKGATSLALSTTSFVQGELRAKWILPLGEEGRVLLRSQVAATSARHFEDMPISLRYFAGGDQSVRGYGYQKLGPMETDVYGNVINVGGPYLAVGSLEVERNIYKQFSAAAFVDTGNAMNKWSSRMYSGAGIGIRYATPLGPLRIDFARALLRGKIKPRIHITFGMDL